MPSTRPAAAGLDFRASVWQPWRDRLPPSVPDQVAALAALGVRRLVIQQTVHDPARRDGAGGWIPWEGILLDPPGVASPVAGALLEAARVHRLAVDVGLAWPDQRVWGRVTQGDDVGAVDDLLARRFAADTAAAAAWRAAFDGHPAWRGWYLADEVDDLAWHVRWPDAADGTPVGGEVARPARARFVAHLQALVATLCAGDGDVRRPVALSGFANRATPPSTLRSQWTAWWRDLPIDELLWQCSCGAHGTPIDQAADQLDAVRAAAAAARVDPARVTPLAELFDGEAPADAAVMAARIDLARSRAGAAGWICFSVEAHVLGRDDGAA